MVDYTPFSRYGSGVMTPIIASATDNYLDLSNDNSSTDVVEVDDNGGEATTVSSGPSGGQVAAVVGVQVAGSVGAYLLDSKVCQPMIKDLFMEDYVKAAQTNDEELFKKTKMKHTAASFGCSVGIGILSGFILNGISDAILNM